MSSILTARHCVRQCLRPRPLLPRHEVLLSTRQFGKWLREPLARWIPDPPKDIKVKRSDDAKDPHAPRRPGGKLSPNLPEAVPFVRIFQKQKQNPSPSVEPGRPHPPPPRPPRTYSPYIFRGWQDMYFWWKEFDYKSSPLGLVPRWWLVLACTGMATIAYLGLVSFPTVLREFLNQKRFGLKDEEVMGPRRWTPVDILRSAITTSPSNLVDDVGDGKHKLISVAIPPNYLHLGHPDPMPMDRLSISSVAVKQPDMQIERNYSALQCPVEAKTRHFADFLVKRYDDGEMGRYLHSLVPHKDELSIRGWILSWDEQWMGSAKDGPIDEVVFVVGGTGIAPAYQLIQSILNNTGPVTRPDLKFQLMYASQSPSSFLLLPELKALQDADPERLKVGLWSESSGGSGGGGFTSLRNAMQSVRPIAGLDTSAGRITSRDLSNVLQRDGDEQKKRRAILVCGPDGMVNAIAGPKGAGGQGQGRLGGALAEVEGVEQGEVWKL